MARADLLCALIKYGLINDSVNFKKAAEALCAEERAKQHTILANKIEDLLYVNKKHVIENNNATNIIRNGANELHLFTEKIPQRRIDDLILPNSVKGLCEGVVEEQLRAELLQSYGVGPRNRVLLIGPPRNGKNIIS